MGGLSASIVQAHAHSKLPWLWFITTWEIIQIDQPKLNQCISILLATSSRNYFHESMVQNQIRDSNPNSFHWWNPRTWEGDSMKYRWDMVEELAESPGMRSDCPGITTNDLDLDVFPRAWERRRESFLMMCAVWWEVVRGTSIISQVWPTPPFCPVADCPRNPDGPSAYEL